MAHDDVYAAPEKPVVALGVAAHAIARIVPAGSDGPMGGHGVVEIADHHVRRGDEEASGTPLGNVAPAVQVATRPAGDSPGRLVEGLSRRVAAAEPKPQLRMVNPGGAGIGKKHPGVTGHHEAIPRADLAIKTPERGRGRLFGQHDGPSLAQHGQYLEHQDHRPAGRKYGQGRILGRDTQGLDKGFHTSRQPFLAVGDGLGPAGGAGGKSQKADRVRHVASGCRSGGNMDEKDVISDCSRFGPTEADRYRQPLPHLGRDGRAQTGGQNKASGPCLPDNLGLSGRRRVLRKRHKDKLSPAGGQNDCDKLDGVREENSKPVAWGKTKA